MKVIAIESFDHGRRVHRGDELEVSAKVAEQLKKKGLVSIDGGTPSPGRGVEPSSASPAALRSPPKTSKPSADGGKAKKAAKKASKKTGA